MTPTETTHWRMRSKLHLKLFLWGAKVSRQFYTRFRSGRTLTVQGKSFHYSQAPYNFTWRNERTVEIPIFQDAIAQYQPSQILEVGNVLTNYTPISHEVVDKYEIGPGVQNVDIVNYEPGRTFDLIIAISTLEHVGWDEELREPAKVRRAIDHLRGLLSPTGKLMVSLPIGHNPEVDALLSRGDIAWNSLVCLKRDRWDNVWHAVSLEDIAPKDGAPARYNYSIPTATAIVVGTVGPA
jgi:hypothetical protein